MMVATASDMVRFMSSTLTAPLRDGLVPVDTNEAPWRKPHYSYGLMVDPGICYGHGGSGPGYAAACFHFEREALTGCCLVAEDEPREIPIATLQRLVAAHA